MENKSSISPLPPSYVTIKDLREQWLKRRQQLQGEHPETGKEKDKQQLLQQQPESRSASQSLHADRVNRVEENNSAGHGQAGGEVGKPGRIPWERWVRYSGPSGLAGDRKPESGRWWSPKENRGNAGVEANRESGGANSWQEEGCGDSGSRGKGVGDQPVSKSQILVVENVVGAAGTGVSALPEQDAADGKNARSMKGVKDESRSNNNYIVEEKRVQVAIGGRQKPPKEKPCERVSPSKGVKDKPRPESNALNADKRVETGAAVVLNGATDELLDDVSRLSVLSSKGMRDLSRSKCKIPVRENEEVVAGVGQALLEGAAGEDVLLKKGRGRSSRKKKSKVVENGVAAAAGYAKDLPEGATAKSVPLRMGMRDESRSKKEDMVKENQMEMAEVSFNEGAEDEGGLRSRSMPLGNGLNMAGGGELVLPEDVTRESDTAKSKKGVKKNKKGKKKKVVSAESTVTKVEAGPRVRDVIRVNLAHEIEEQFHNMSTENNDGREGNRYPVRMDRGGYRKNSCIYRRKEASNQVGGEMVWVKRGETATGSGRWHSSASPELLK